MVTAGEPHQGKRRCFYQVNTHSFGNCSLYWAGKWNNKHINVAKMIGKQTSKIGS